MREEDRMRRRILERLRSLPEIKAYCLVCGKYIGTFAHPRRIVHQDCVSLPRTPR